MLSCALVTFRGPPELKIKTVRDMKLRGVARLFRAGNTCTLVNLAMAPGTMYGVSPHRACQAVSPAAAAQNSEGRARAIRRHKAEPQQLKICNT